MKTNITCVQNHRSTFSIWRETIILWTNWGVFLLQTAAIVWIKTYEGQRFAGAYHTHQSFKGRSSSNMLFQELARKSSSETTIRPLDL